MSIGSFDLNLVRREGSGRRGLMVVVAADTVCAGCGDSRPVIQTLPIADIDLMAVPRAPGVAKRSAYDRFCFGERVGAWIDLIC